MKNILVALTVFTSGFAQYATAQDPTVAVPTERTEAAAVEEPSPTPVRNMVATSAPKKKSPAPKESSSEPTPKKSAAPVSAAAPAKKLTGEAALRDMENRWVASVPSHDPTVAQQVLADDYAGVSSGGQLMNKGGLLKQIKQDTDVYASAKINKMDVRMFGGAAVVIGISTEKGKDQRGTAFTRNYRWTDTWLLRHDKWQCVASQSAQIAR